MSVWGIIGVGNIGSALAGGLNIAGQRPYIYDKNHDKVLAAQQRTDCDIAVSASDVLATCAIVFLCLRANQINEFLSHYLDKILGTVVLFQAGLSRSNLPVAVQQKKSFLRAITNINVMSGHGYTILMEDESPSYPEVRDVLRRMGEVLEVDTEEKLELYSLPPGCGPAPVLEFYQQLKDEAARLGMDEALAARIAANVITGSINAMQASEMEPAELATKVGTKGGVVEQAIREMQERQGFGRELSTYFSRIRGV